MRRARTVNEAASSGWVFWLVLLVLGGIAAIDVMAIASNYIHTQNTSTTR